jgi:predicted RNase H-like HicB family nuclease
MAKEKMIKEYVALFEYEDDMKGYSVIFPDLPGCFSAGDDYDEAVRNAHEALALYADGETNLPAPRSLEQIKKEWADWAEWEKDYKFMVCKVALYPLKTGAQRFNISMRSDLVARIDRVASNRSAFIETAAENLLRHGEYSEPTRKQAQK